MKEEIRRINKLVAEGKLSPDDAAELIEAFVNAESSEAAHAEAEGAGEAKADGAATPGPKDAFKAFFESIEKLVHEGKESVNWDEVGRQAKTAAKQSMDRLKIGIEDISKGKVNINWFGSQSTREIELPLSVTPGKTLKIENPCGDIKVVGGFDVASIKADAHFRGSNAEDAKAKADAYTLIVEESDHAVVVKQPDVVGLCVDVEIQVPAGCPVEVRSESGDIQILDTKASAKVTSRSGDIKVRGLDGSIEISSENGDIVAQDAKTPALSIENKRGDITIQRVAGNVNARTATGDVVVEHSSGKVVSVESVSGNVRVDVEEPVSGSMNIRTVNGHASVAVPDGCDCRVSLSTLRGEVMCSLELQEEARSDQRVTGRLGSGSGTLDVSAVTGSICLEIHNAAVA